MSKSNLNLLLSDAGSTTRRQAMTIVEVSTSTACIAILLAVMAISATEVRREAKELRCLSNLGRIAAASLTYAQSDPGEIAVPIHGRVDSVNILPRLRRGYGGKSGIGEPLAGGDPLSSKYGTLEGMGPATRPLNRVLYKHPFPEHAKNPGTFGQNWLDDTNLDLDVYRCPGDTGYTGYNYLPLRDSGLSAYDHYGTSYVPITSFVITGPGSPLRSNSAFARPISRVPVPSETILYMETNGQFGWRINYATEGCTSSVSPPPGGTVIEGWHGRAWTFSSTFADGHVRPVRMEGHISPSPFLGRYPDCTDSINNCHQFWRCVIFRGPGWRLDTLPAPPVNIGITWNGSVYIPFG